MVCLVMLFRCLNGSLDYVRNCLIFLLVYDGLR